MPELFVRWNSLLLYLMVPPRMLPEIVTGPLAVPPENVL